MLPCRRSLGAGIGNKRVGETSTYRASSQGSQCYPKTETTAVLGTCFDAARCPPQEGPMKNHQQAEYYKRAAEARRLAKETLDPDEKVDLFKVEQGWLSLARNATDAEDLVR